MLACLLCSHQALLLLMQAMGTPWLEWGWVVCFCLPLIHALQQHMLFLSKKDKQDGSRAQLILKMDFAVRWHGSERVGGRKEHQTHCLHKHVSECAHTCTHVLSSKTCAAACHSPGSAALHKSNLLQSPVQCWEFFSQV